MVLDPGLVEAIACDGSLFPINNYSTKRIGLLNERERQILTGASAGMTVQQIAAALMLSYNTIKTHLQRISARLGARNTTHAVALGLIGGEIGLRHMSEANRPTLAERTRVDAERTHKVVKRAAQQKSKPLPPDLAERFPSVQWQEQEWLATFTADEDLFGRLLTGIGRVVSREQPHLGRDARHGR